jgi:Tfp pilus assembly protein PilV
MPRRQKSGRGRPAKRGFGLLEVMISGVLLASGMAATLSTLSALSALYEHERLLGNALHVAESTMEGLLLRYANDADLAATGGTPRTGASYTKDGMPGGTFFSTGWLVRPGVPIGGAREIEVIVSWAERGIPKTLTLKTVRT